MENQNKSKFNDHLRERTIQMAANCRAATHARSDAEFYAKICIVVEECDETLFWLEFLIRINLLDVDKTKEIYSEVEELVRLFNAIKSKMKIKIREIKNLKSEI